MNPAGGMPSRVIIDFHCLYLQVAAAAGAGGPPNEPGWAARGGVGDGLRRHCALQALPHLHQPLRHLDRRRPVSAGLCILEYEHTRSIPQYIRVAGIVRCKRCRTFVNPFVTWVDGGRCTHSLPALLEQPMHIQNQMHPLAATASTADTLHIAMYRFKIHALGCLQWDEIMIVTAGASRAMCAS